MILVYNFSIMKIFVKYIFLFIIFFSVSSTFACKIAELWKQIPKDFKENCFEFTWKLSPKLAWVDIWNWEKCIWYQTLKIKTNKKINTFISWYKIIPFKLYKNPWEEINYKIKNLDWNLDYLKDNNYKTFLIYDEEKNISPIEIQFDEILKAWSFEFNFEYKANYRTAQIEISKNWKKYYLVDKYKISDYDLKYVKIYFTSTVKHITPPEKIKIFELNFTSKNYIYLVSTRWEIKAYSQNICKNYYPNLTNNNWNFNIDKYTSSLSLELEKNNNLNPNKIEDSDNDWVANQKDNCPTIFNPMQKDKNWDWKWDLCSDNDKDWIIWNKDNCIYIYNPDQKDINRNWVWDKCEFDKDKDSIYDSLDNCINIVNPDQKDSDNDGIWDLCDNCKLYNPRQIDKNWNSIWDICEQAKKILKENDKDKDWVVDYKDNCKEVSNPDQLDTDKDSIWDLCDNCKDIQNSLQIDKDLNGVWDMCEDSDKDWYLWYLDNCINIANPDQKDSDNDGIWDLCEDDDGDNILFSVDNCPYDYNPVQKDIDNDGIWDKCDKWDNRFIESNKGVFIWLLILIVLIFWWWIFFMVKKLNNKKG